MCSMNNSEHASNDYHFITHWRLPGTVEEVAAIIGDAEGLTRWWPSVYLAVKTLEPGGPDGLGKVVDLYTKGWLPYTLRWQFRVTEVHSNGFTLEAWGDFVGRGIWTFVQDGDDVLVVYDWKIQAEKPLLRRLSWLMKPVFGANHRWAMARGEESLRLELARRRAERAGEAWERRAPPGPTRWPSPAAVALGAAGLAAGVWWLRRRGRGQKSEVRSRKG
jgi:hypothetical protein